jgi:Kef-type K+ transport system membrane component KefB
MLRTIAFALLIPFFFLRAGRSSPFSALDSGIAVISVCSQ